MPQTADASEPQHPWEQEKNRAGLRTNAGPGIDPHPNASAAGGTNLGDDTSGAPEHARQNGYPFFAYMYRLRYIRRWSLMRSVTRENVAEHAYQVALLTHALCTIGNELFGRSYPTEHAVALALFHDATEVFTGDIPTPVKHHNRDILRHFREIEREAAERLAGMVPEPLRRVYRPLIAGDTDRDDVRRILKAADLLDAYLKCVTEQTAGNREFSVAQKQIEQAMRDMALPELDYFLQQFAPSFSQTLDEMAKSENGSDPSSDA